MTALSPASPGRTDVTANLICMASMVVWAAGLPAANLLIPHVPALPLAAMRTGLAAAVLLPVWWAVEGATVMRAAAWGRGVVVGGICLGLAAILLIVAQAATDAATVAVIAATSPVFGMLLEAALDGRRITRRMVLGLAFSLGGGLMAYGAAVGSLSLGVGAAAAFGSVLCYTWGSRATVEMFPAMTPLGRTAITASGAAVTTGAAAAAWAAFGGAAPDWAALGWREAGALALFGIGSIAISQLLWITSVGRLGIGVASLHTNAAPFYVMLILLAFGGGWNWSQAAGAAVVVAGVLVAQGILPPVRSR